jgi:hypothetical protein
MTFGLDTNAIDVLSLTLLIIPTCFDGEARTVS